MICSIANRQPALVLEYFVTVGMHVSYKIVFLKHSFCLIFVSIVSKNQLAMEKLY
jgi:hypothetical protein